MSYTVSYYDDGSDESLEPIYSLYRSPRGTWTPNEPLEDDSEFEDFMTWIDSLSDEDDEDYPWDDEDEDEDEDEDDYAKDFDELLEDYYLYADADGNMDYRWHA
jgi:hypothetical protein